MNSRSGKVQTVLGLIEGVELGVTLAHDHVLIDGTFMYVEPEEMSQKGLAHEEITLQNRGWVAYNWTSNRHNVELNDEHIAVAELKRFVAAGGRSIIDPTNIGLGRDPQRIGTRCPFDRHECGHGRRVLHWYHSSGKYG